MHGFASLGPEAPLVPEAAQLRGGNEHAARETAWRTVLPQRAVAPSSEPRPEPASPLAVDDVTRSVAFERYTVEMTLVTFFMILAASLIYQGATTTGGASGYFIAGLLVVGATIPLAWVTRRRLLGRLVAVHQAQGLARHEALACARGELARFMQVFGAGRPGR